MFCRTCANQIDDNAVVCVHCGVPPFAGNNHCQNCGSQTHPESTVCVKCGVQLRRQSQSGRAGIGSVSQNEPILMALASYFAPGLGQILMGQTVKGAVMLAVSIIACGALAVGGIFLLLPCCLIPFVPAIPAIDAFLIATKIQKGISIDEWTCF